MFFCRFRLLLLLAVFCGLAFLTTSHAQEGTWDAGLKCRGGSIRYVLKIQKDTKEKWSAWLINATERIEVPSVVMQDDQTLLLDINHYDSRLNIVPGPNGKRLSGEWKKRRAADKWSTMKLEASIVSAESVKQKTDSSFDGRWQVKFSSSEEPAVGKFETNKSTGMMLGTFLTSTGDYRYLAGSASQGSMELSCFDGAHAFLFKAKLLEDGTLSGDFWSSKHWHETWTAKRDDLAKLPDSFAQTKATSENINSLSFPDLDGNVTKLDDKRFLAPVRIVHIFGSWCPNCHDAGAYLAQLKKKHGDKISIVGIAFELTGNFDRDAAQVQKYLQRHKLDHPVLIGGGSSSKEKASEAITFIDRVRSYPTTVFANQKGNIIAVHQGFSGPATGSAFEDLKINFEKVIAEAEASNK